MKDEFLKFKEVMDYLKVSRTTIYDWLYAGKIKAYKIGKSVRFKRSDIEAFIKEWRPK